MEGRPTHHHQNPQTFMCALQLTPNMGPRTAPETDFSDILYKVVTPYNPQAWQLALHKADITLLYPNLVHDLTHGSPISNPLLLWYTFIPNNLTSANIHPEYITNLITAEVAAGRMDSPFTIEQAHIIYGGHFRTCPLGLVEKLGLSALWMIHHFSKEDDYGVSTNSWVDSDDFPTCWFTVAQTADFVSPDFFILITLNIPF